MKPLFSLGDQYVSDFVEKSEVKAGNKVPIDIERCGQCTLVQAKHAPPAEILYKGTYWYRSGVTDTMKRALRDVTESIENRVNLLSGDVVLDIGSNDGTLLRSYSHKKLITVGVEPATNLVEEGRVGVSMLLNDLWSIGAYQNALGGRKAKVITAIGMFYDLEDPNQFIRDVSLALAEDGLFVAQLMCLKQTLENCDVGNFAHEHLEFYTLRSLHTLFDRHGLQIVEVEENGVNGGSYRIYAKHRDPNRLVASTAAVRHEDALACSDSKIEAFFQEINRNRMACVKFVQDAVADRKRVWVYGASTKGNVILQMYGLHHSTTCPRCGGKGSRGDVDVTSDLPMTCKSCLGEKKVTLIEGAADRDPNKWGRYTVGTGVPIMSEEYARTAKPDYFLVLPYAFRDEFIARESEFLAKGGKFIFPLPKFVVV